MWLGNFICLTVLCFKHELRLKFSAIERRQTLPAKGKLPYCRQATIIVRTHRKD